MTQWSRLHHAYGTAEDLPEVLEAAESSRDWDNAYSRLFHQGTVYSASIAALPLLTEMALRHRPAGHVAPMDLAAAILSARESPDPDVRKRARTEHSAQVSALRELAQRRLADATSAGEFVYLLQALMAFEDVDPWQRSLDHLADGEAPLECPTCDLPLLLDLTETLCTLAPFDEPARRTETAAAEPSPSGAEQRMLALTERHGWSRLTAPMHALFGTAQCPACRAEFAVPAAVV